MVLPPTVRLELRLTSIVGFCFPCAHARQQPRKGSAPASASEAPRLTARLPRHADSEPDPDSCCCGRVGKPLQNPPWRRRRRPSGPASRVAESGLEERRGKEARSTLVNIFARQPQAVCPPTRRGSEATPASETALGEVHGGASVAAARRGLLRVGVAGSSVSRGARSRGGTTAGGQVEPHGAAQMVQGIAGAQLDCPPPCVSRSLAR